MAGKAAVVQALWDKLEDEAAQAAGFKCREQVPTPELSKLATRYLDTPEGRRAYATTREAVDHVTRAGAGFRLSRWRAG